MSSTSCVTHATIRSSTLFIIVLILEFTILIAAPVVLVSSCLGCATTYLSSALNLDCLLAILPCTFEGSAAVLAMILGVPAFIVGMVGFGVFVLSGRRSAWLRRLSLICCFGPVWSVAVFISSTMFRYGLYDAISKNNQCPAFAARVDQ